MANKRMFSLDVIDTDKFLDMPASTQCLYFQLGMRADDEGFVSSPKKITKIANCAEDDLRVLASKGYIIPFESGIIVITDWNVNNSIRSDRKHDTRFREERSRLMIKDNAYSLTTNCQADDNQLTDKCHTEVSIGLDKYRLDKNSIDINTICSEPETAPELSGIKIILNDKSYYDIPLEKIALWKETYPAVDIEQELRKMAAWSDANPAKRKTRRGITRFINSWLSREQDRGGRRRQDNSRGMQQDKPFYEVEQPEYLKYLNTELTPEEKAILGEG